MDHLPTPKNSVRSEPAFVPYVCKKEYDGQPFLTYPIREGVPYALPPDGNVPGGSPYWQHEQIYPTPKQELEDFFQRWLFFGLINEILGDLCRSESFTYVKENDDGPTELLSTSKLAGIVDKWVANVQAGQINPRPTYEHVAECLRLAFATLYAAGPDFDPQVKLSIASVGELLSLAANEAYGVSYTPKCNKCPNTWSQLIDRSYWEKIMLLAGWCPSQTRSTLGPTAYLQTLHFATCLGQPKSISERHQNCYDQHCANYQINIDTYQTQHVTSQCKCPNLSVNTDYLAKILESGSLPLLRIQKVHITAELSIELVASEPASRYVALSHVWADGLGNPRDNAIPRCQLDTLYQLNRKLSAVANPRGYELLLWCDTLCCPLRPTEAKNLALTQMKRTYLEATRVLVLDSSLRLCNSEKMDAEEICMRLLSSGWIRRLWTLQEGVLPAENQRLWFQFEDGPINIHILMGKLIEISERSIGRKGLANNILTRIGHFAAFSHSSPEEGITDLGSIEASLQHRSVSVRSDEPLLIGNLLNLDVAEILNGPEYSRIHRMWFLISSSLRGIPDAIIFRVGPRLDEVGFRWAPATLLHNVSGNSRLYTPRESNRRGLLTERGLLLRLTGYHLSMPLRPARLPSNPWNINEQGQSNMLYSRDADGNWYLFSRRLPEDQDDFPSTKPLRSIIHEASNLWIIPEKTDFTDSAAQPKDAQQATKGLLVELVREEKEVYYVTSKLHLKIGFVGKSTGVLHEAAYQAAQQVPQTLPAQKYASHERKEAEMGSLEYEANLQALRSDIDGIAKGADRNVLAIAQQHSTHGSGLFTELIAMMFVGEYGCVGQKTLDSQQWCFD
ncbi:hypothetical protein MMC28_001516 [Mycoblastus sanguinarius]|nr:hypothetical protein [Mycoblastus sanguinarius]